MLAKSFVHQKLQGENVPCAFRYNSTAGSLSEKTLRVSSKSWNPELLTVYGQFVFSNTYWQFNDTTISRDAPS